MNNYIDCHSHILFGIDDGAKKIEDSIEILKKLESLGFEEVILTPHYKNAYHTNNQEKNKVLTKLRKKMRDENINIKLHLANEVRICSDMNDLIEKKEIKLIKNYLFLELPFSTNVVNLNNTIFELQAEGINIILVHPERYNYLKIKDYEKLIDSDIEFQINYESILGNYGHLAKKKVKYFLKNNMVTYIGTDVHRSNSVVLEKFKKIEKKTIKLIGKEKYKDLTYNNIKKILKGSK